MASTELKFVNDYETKALSMLEPQHADYFATGADQEQTLAENKSDFKR